MSITSINKYHAMTGHEFRKMVQIMLHVYSNKEETSDFHGAISFDPVKVLQQNYNQNVYQTSDTQKMVII